MTGAEIIALLSAVGTGVAGSAIYDGIKNAKALLPISNDRKKAIAKKWTGLFSQVHAGSPVSTSISLDLKVKRKFIVGTGEYAGSDGKVEIEVLGGFYREDHLHLSYKNKDGADFQHGFIILHVPNKPTKLTGKFVGIGLDSNAIVAGDIEINA